MLRTALALALTLAAAANAAQSLGPPRELAPELVLVPLATHSELTALCAELEAAAKNSRHGVSAKTDAGTAGRVPSTQDFVCEIFVVDGRLVVAGTKAQFLSHDPVGFADSYSLYAFAGFDPINRRDPFGLAEGVTPTPTGPRPVPPPAPPASKPAPWSWSPLSGPSPAPGAGAGAAAAESSMLGRAFGSGSLMLFARDNRDPRIPEPETPTPPFLLDPSEKSFPGVNTLNNPGAGTPGPIDPLPTLPTPSGPIDPPSGGTPLTDPLPPGDPLDAAKPGPKPGWEGPHNQKIQERIQEIAEEHPDWEHIGGKGSGRPELVIPTPGGIKSKRRPDISHRDPTGERHHENVGLPELRDPTKPIKRERDAIDDLLKGTGKKPRFTPYKKTKPSNLAY